MKVFSTLLKRLRPISKIVRVITQLIATYLTFKALTPIKPKRKPSTTAIMGLSAKKSLKRSGTTESG